MVKENTSGYEGNKNAQIYDESYIIKVDKYLKASKDRNKRVLKQENNEKGYLTYETKLQVKLPTIEGFAIYAKIGRQTVYYWIDKYPDFAEAIEKIKTEQKKRLIDSGLSGDYNSTIAKLILSSNHGMRDRVDNTSGDEPINNNFTDDQINRIAERVLERGSEKPGNSSSEE